MTIGITNFAYLLKSNFTNRTKLRIFFLWLKTIFKYIFLSKLFKLKKEYIFGYKINAFNYGTIKGLFGEIFVKNEYLFNTETTNPIIFDCGANIGFATIFFKWLYPKSEIYAFEPDNKTFEILKKNISQNKIKNVHLFNSAISDKNGKIDFFSDFENPGSLCMSTKKTRGLKNQITVNCISLSEFLKKENIAKIDYLKMDIEGSESEAIQDLDKNHLLQNIEKYSIEYHHKIGNCKSELSKFLNIFEKNKFEYQIDTRCFPINSENKFQDILLYIYKSIK